MDTWRQGWVGSATKETQTFSIASPEWRVTWIVLTPEIVEVLARANIDWRVYKPTDLCKEVIRRISASPAAARGRVSIFVHGADGKQVAQVAQVTGWGCETSYVRAGPGRYYLRIVSDNVFWVVTVEHQL